MTKDRLNDLKKAINNDNSASEISLLTINPNSSDDIRQILDGYNVLNQWIETIEINVEKIRQELRLLDDITTNHTDVNFNVEELFKQNTTIANRIQKKLKTFEIQEETNETNNTAHRRIKNLQLTTIKIRFRKCFERNSMELNRFHEIRKSGLAAQLRTKNVNLTDDELNRLIDSNDISVFTGNIVKETNEQQQMLHDLEDRHRQLQNIEQMIEQVHTLFLEMAYLIEDQQEIIDRVEYQAGQASVLVGQGRQDLRKGERRKNKYLKWKIISIIIGLILLAIILALIFK